MTMTGTIILCDKVYTTNEGRHVIAGTYSHWNAGVPSLKQAICRFDQGLNFYIRFMPERTGTTKVTVRIKDESRQVWDHSWMTSNFEVPVGNPMPRMVEMAVSTPSFKVEMTSDESQERVVLRNSIELSLDDQLIATTPFEVVFFVPPSGQQTPPQTPPEPGHE